MLPANAAGVGAGLVLPVYGDWVAAGTSGVVFAVEPSGTHVVDLLLDGVGALPFVGSLGSIRRAERLADKGSALASKGPAWKGGAWRDPATGRFAEGPGWRPGSQKGAAKLERQMAKRGWTPDQITEAMQGRQTFPATNLVNNGNSATRYVHPTTGRSVVIDDVTKEVIHVGGDGFKY